MSDELVTPANLMFPDRGAWARSRQTVYADDVDMVLEDVGDDPADYATRTEVVQAATELGDLWRQLGREVREANKAARAAWPLYGSRHRKRSAVLALAADRDRLSPEKKAVVEHADAVKHHRQLIGAALEQLRRDAGPGRLHLRTIVNAQKWMPAGACPTWRTIVDRWKQARGHAGEDYAEQVQQRPTDDDAWRLELDRRAQIKMARARGHLC
ncbi:hypothetical protein [Pseudosporangium ferrugineum]|uniref:Uncharacterized protein n=1 Tax=Pseudosporangium ferrugineum TaxID=439699 RepID=A0A2T0RS85_9ACTN|nr:hypothetical protein [Pseudosporangium ferrugineum]PRY24056.1 hypothetical protein CLV70_114189 [Pseudosporangium ferrugineum]